MSGSSLVVNTEVLLINNGPGRVKIASRAGPKGVHINASINICTHLNDLIIIKATVAFVSLSYFYEHSSHKKLINS